MSRMTNFDITVRPAGSIAPVEPYYDPILDALSAATDSIWTIDWERQAPDFLGFGTPDTLSSVREADFVSRLADAVRTVLPGASVKVRAIDLDSAPFRDYEFEAGS